jgi:hypothetical protein
MFASNNYQSSYKRSKNMRTLQYLAIVALVGHGQSILTISVAEMQKQILSEAIAESTEKIKELTADVENAKTTAVTPQQDGPGRPSLKKEEWQRITTAKLAMEQDLLRKLKNLEATLTTNNAEMQKHAIRTALIDNAEQIKNIKILTVSHPLALV